MTFLRATLLLGAAGVCLTTASSARADDDDVPPITVRPHLEGADGLHLEQRGRSEQDWQKVCDAPCDREIRLDGTYRVAGPDIVTSNGFQLHGRVGERVNVTVDRTSTERRETGKVVLIGGIIGVGTGLSLATIYAGWGIVDGFSNAGCGLTGTLDVSNDSGSASGSATCGHASPPKGLLWASVGTLAVGVGALIAGLVVMSPTSAQQAPAVRVELPPDDRSTPPPQVNGPASFLPPAPATSMPLLSGTF